MVILANALSAAGYDVDFVVASYQGRYVGLTSDAVQTIDLKAASVLRAVPRLAGYLRRQSPDAFMSTMTHANVAAMLAILLAGRTSSMKIVLRQANVFSDSFKSVAPWKYVLFRQLVSALYPRARRVVAISHQAAADMRAIFPRLQGIITAIHNPIDAEAIDALKVEAVDTSVIDARVPCIVAAGRLVEGKDFALLIRAVAILRERREARLIILGEGPERPALEQLIQELGLENSVILGGFESNPFRYMHRAALFVSSSRSEGFGNVLVEAMACGAPIVSTSCPGGPAEILENGKWGRLVPVGDAEALAKAMADTLDDPSPPDVRRRAMDFGVDRAVDAYLDALGLPPTPPAV
jgi:glycosyltransferase involved in cell wall biosynthesis